LFVYEIQALFNELYILFNLHALYIRTPSKGMENVHK